MSTKPLLARVGVHGEAAEGPAEDARSRLQKYDVYSQPGGAPLSPYFEPLYEEQPEQPPAATVTLLDMLEMVRSGWWIIALTALTSLSMALLSIYFATPLYKSSAQIILSPNPELEGSQAAYIQSALEKRFTLTTIAELLDSPRIYNETGAMLQLTPELLEQYERATVVLPETTILEHSVTGPDPQVAALLANTIGQRAIEFAKGKYQAYEAAFLNLAVPPTEPVSPQPAQTISLSLGLGLILGVGLAVLRGFLTSEKSLGLPWRTGRGRGLGDEGDPDAWERLAEALEHNPAPPLSLALVRLEMAGALSLSEEARHDVREQATQLLRRELRGKDLIISWDEQTLVVLVPNVPGEQARRALDHMRRLLADALQWEQGGQLMRVEPRVGVTERAGDEPAETLVEQAESALEEARRTESPSALFSAAIPTWA